MIFVLMLFLARATIFGWMRYVDVRDGIEKSRKDYAAQIHSIYAMTLKRTSAFYLNRAYANLDSYGIKEALEQKNVAQLTGLSSFRWNVLKQENPYLLGIRFYDETLSLPVTVLVCLAILGSIIASTPNKIKKDELKISKDMMWNNACPGPAWFKIRFVRDIHTRGLFSYYDTSLCKSNILKRIIRNAKDNTERRVRDFCWYVNTSPDICTIDISDDEITEYIMWLSKHTSSPRSTMAALLLFYLDIRFANILSPDQLQFIRENPNLKIR